jgi:hypothetical protein
MSFSVVDVDTDSGHSGSSSQYFAQVAGWYWVEGFVAFVNTNVQSRIDISIAKNGSIIQGAQQSVLKTGSDYSAAGASALVQMAVGDYVETYAAQFSGSAMNTLIAADICPAMNVLWIHS